jgi:succinoglycan biosynthesis transport protein ExoP
MDGTATTLNDYLRVLRARKWIVLIVIVVAPVVAGLLSHRGATRYEASAQVLVNRQNLPANLAGVNDPTQLDSARLLATQAQFARLPAVARRTVRAVGLPAWYASDLLGASRVTASTSTDFLTFTVSDPHALRAVRLATAYARQYVAYRRQYQTAQLAASDRAVRKRLQKLGLAGESGSALYASLVEKADELATMEAVAATTGALVRPASGAGRVASHYVRDIIFAFVVALIAGIGLAFLRDALDPRARSADQIGDRLQLRLLGRLPRPPRALRRANRLSMLEDPESPYAEAFRMLRTSLEFVRSRGPNESRSNGEPGSERPAAKRGYRLMVTSAVEGEGKSTTVANLAVAFARAGRDVLLVDLDFRRASLHRLFGLDFQPGLTDVLLGSAPLSAVASEISLGSQEHVEWRRTGRLRVVPLGTMPPHVADIDFTLGIDHALDRLASDADLVLIDSPPLLRVGDALALTSYVDGLLVVASLRTVRAPMLDELRRVLEGSPVAKLGFVLTGADLEGGYQYLAYRYHRRALNAG